MHLPVRVVVPERVGDDEAQGRDGGPRGGVFFSGGNTSRYEEIRRERVRRGTDEEVVDQVRGDARAVQALSFWVRAKLEDFRDGAGKF